VKSHLPSLVIRPGNKQPVIQCCDDKPNLLAQTRLIATALRQRA